MNTSRFANKVTLKIRADRYNPFIEDDNILSSDFVSSLLETTETSTTHRYHSGINEIVA